MGRRPRPGPTPIGCAWAGFAARLRPASPASTTVGLGEVRFALLYWLARDGSAVAGLGARRASAAATSACRAR